MARRDTGKRIKVWKAEIKHNYVARYAGHHHTKEEAEQAERALRLRLTGVAEPLIGEAKVQWASEQ